MSEVDPNPKVEVIHYGSPIDLLKRTLIALGIYYTSDQVGKYDWVAIDGDDNGEVVDLTFYFEREGGKFHSIDVG